MKRRAFLKGSAMILAAAGASDILHAAPLAAPEAEPVPDESPEGAEGALIASAPMLQNYAENSIGVVFAVSALANGYVLIGEKPDLSDARKVKCGGFRTTALDDKVSQIRVSGLKPSTTYYYRIGADRIHYGNGYNMKILGNEEASEIYSFKTAGAKSAGHFCVINDTHVHWDTMTKLTDKIDALAPSCVIWNGDISNREEKIGNLIKIYLKPEMERKDYASRIPYLLCPGNHDQRGRANRRLEDVWMFRQNEERSPRDWDLGRNFAVRMGDVALIGLDTGEAKLDTNPLFAGLFNNGAYREAQTLWLKDVLKRKEIAKAPYLVAFCHIPLFDPREDANPGDIAPADTDPRYTTDYAAWQRTCARMWAPLLEKAHCQLVITGHQHCFRYDEPTKDRPWAQIVGGGPHLKPGKGFPTLIEGQVRDGKLVITVHDIATDTIPGTHTFKPRR